VEKYTRFRLQWLEDPFHTYYWSEDKNTFSAPNKKSIEGQKLLIIVSCMLFFFLGPFVPGVPINPLKKKFWLDSASYFSLSLILMCVDCQILQSWSTWLCERRNLVNHSRSTLPFWIFLKGRFIFDNHSAATSTWCLQNCPVFLQNLNFINAVSE